MKVKLDFYDLTKEDPETQEQEHHLAVSRNSRSASVGSNTSGHAELYSVSPAADLNPFLSGRNSRSSDHSLSMAMFEVSTLTVREPPTPPETEGIDYARAASWSGGSCLNVLADDKGRQLFRCFLFQAFADENLGFLESVEKLKKMKSSQDKKDYAKEIINTYSTHINLSSSAMKKIKDAAVADTIDAEEFAPAVKEVKRLLENDQFPRFRRSEVYLNFLEALLPLSIASKWSTSFEALLNNHVGRHHFRLFLRSIHAEENLRFWEAVVEYRGARNKSAAMLNFGKVILNTYLAEGTPNEVFLPFGLRQNIEHHIENKDVDLTLFDEAVKHVEQVLRNDPYVRFLQSTQYQDLMSKLKD